MKLRGERGDGASFLLESVEGGERIARYSFIGVKPRAQYIIVERDRSDHHGRRNTQYDGDHLFSQEEMSRFKFIPGMPRFIGGLVGYLGYESVKTIEPTLQTRLRPHRTSCFRQHLSPRYSHCADHAP
jgi:anthranilate synthase component 1